MDWNEPFFLEMRVQEIISQQQENGFKFDVKKANLLVEWIKKEQKRLDKKIRPHLTFNVSAPFTVPVSKPFLKNGDYRSSVLSWYEDSSDIVSGPFSRVEFLEPNLDSDPQLKKQLFYLGWKPDEWNYKRDVNKKVIYDRKTKEAIQTSPKLTESSYDSLKVGIGPEIARFLILSHRKSQVEGFLKNVREDGCIPGEANTIGTPTYRFRHKKIVNVPKAKNSVLLGKEMRSLFIARPERVIVGHDASGLEARCEAHNTYSIDADYALELIHGDSHQRNADKWNVDRDKAKNGKYALGYGAYPPKLSKTLGISKRKAQHIFDTFWSDDNPLYTLKRRLEWENKKYGYIEGLDGRKIFVRKKSDLINYKFQSDGAILMKRSIVMLDDLVKEFSVDALKVLDQHDEGQHDVIPEQAHLFGSLAVLSIRKAGEYYNLNIPLDAEYKIGNSWAETH